MTLNGEWQFEIDRKGDGEARGLISGKPLAKKIVVPFCPESKLSGLGLGNNEYFTHVWYRRLVELPEAMKASGSCCTSAASITRPGSTSTACWPASIRARTPRSALKSRNF